MLKDQMATDSRCNSMALETKFARALSESCIYLFLASRTGFDAVQVCIGNHKREVIREMEHEKSN